MGQTLTHGVYLPREGERNCYSGLASNWRLLDGAIGTVAAHTTAIAGKAPLVHTHTKSDITDLFNSANTWSGENKYTSGFILSNISWSGVIPPSSAKPTVIEFKNSDTRQGRYINRISSTSSETWIETIRNVDANTSYNHTVIFKVDNSGNKSVYPSSNNDVDLGIAANQWNNLYAKNYYYNGTAWGLNKDNTWTGDNTFKGIYQNQGDTNFIISRGTNTVKGDLTTSGNFTLMFKDKNNGNLATSGIGYLSLKQTSSGSYATIGVETVGSTDNTRHSNSIAYKIDPTTNDNTAQFYPANNNATDLGTSTNKWKTFNGINPGALSLPDMDSTVSKSTELATAIDKTQTDNSWTADFTGILRITWFVKNLTGPFRCTVSNNSDIRYATWGQTFSVNDAWYFIVSFPVQNGKTYYFNNSFARTSEDTAPIIYGASAVYCLGNV